MKGKWSKFIILTVLVILAGIPLVFGMFVKSEDDWDIRKDFSVKIESGLITERPDDIPIHALSSKAYDISFGWEPEQKSEQNPINILGFTITKSDGTVVYFCSAEWLYLDHVQLPLEKGDYTLHFEVLNDEETFNRFYADLGETVETVPCFETPGDGEFRYAFQFERNTTDRKLSCLLGLGLLVGLWGAALGLCFIMKGDIKAQYDERQKLVQGKGNKIGFMTMIFLSMLLVCLDSFYNWKWIDFSGAIVLSQCFSLILNLSYVIWHDGYFALNQRIITFFVILGLCGIGEMIFGCINLKNAISREIRYPLGGTDLISLALGVTICWICILLAIHSLWNRRKSGEDEDDE